MRVLSLGQSLCVGTVVGSCYPASRRKGGPCDRPGSQPRCAPGAHYNCHRTIPCPRATKITVYRINKTVTRGLYRPSGGVSIKVRVSGRHVAWPRSHAATSSCDQGRARGGLEAQRLQIGRPAFDGGPVQVEWAVTHGDGDAGPRSGTAVAAFDPDPGAVGQPAHVPAGGSQHLLAGPTQERE